MQLLYIWVENFRCLKNNEFNFNYKYKFNFDYEKNSLTISISKYDTLSLLKGGKDVIQDISVVVGENGVGKTTLADLLCTKVNLMGYGSKRIYIIGDKNEISLCCCGEWEDKLKIEVNFDDVSKEEKAEIIKIMKIKDNQLEMELLKNTATNIKRGESVSLTTHPLHELNLWSNKNISFIYDSNAFFHQSVLRKGADFDCIDISLGASYHDDVYFNNEFIKQIEVILHEKEIVEKGIKFKLPSEINMEIYNIDCSNLCTHSFNIMDELKKAIDNLLETCKNKKVNIKYMLMLISIINIGRRIPGIMSFSKEEREEAEKKRKYLRQKSKEYNSIVTSKILNSYSPNGENEISNKQPEEFIASLYKKCTDFVKTIDSIYLKKLRNNIEKLIDLSQGLIFKSEQGIKNGYRIDVSSYENLNNFFSFYKMLLNCEAIAFDVSFSWVMSTGENVLLNIFAKYYSVKRDIKNDSVIIFIDEADLYLHPRWQQKYISLITEYFNMIFEGKKVQLIITTHSPIILSDIPKNHVIFLSKGVNNEEVVTNEAGNHKETFGANIFDLYNDSFFLSKGQSGDAIGILADNSIKKTVKILSYIKGKIKEANYSQRNNATDYNSESNNDTYNKIKDTNIDWRSLDKDLEYCRCVINTLGEPIYKTALQSQYDYINKIRNEYLQKQQSDVNKELHKKQESAVKNALSNIDNLKLNEEDKAIIMNILKRNKND